MSNRKLYLNTITITLGEDLTVTNIVEAGSEPGFFGLDDDDDEYEEG